MKKLAFLVLGLSLFAASCNKNNQPQSLSPTPTPPAPTETYENSYIKVNTFSGWTASSPKSNPRAVNIIKGKYILYINTAASQASGVIGGRFSEIAMGAPSADAVVLVHPTEPCGAKETTQVFDIYSRADLYVSAENKRDDCVLPTNGQTVWYFSYVSESAGGYFNYKWNSKNLGIPEGLGVITMSYNSKDINQFPVKDSSELKDALSQMTEMVKTLVIK